MGQQPNIHLGIEDLPRPEPHPAAPGRWSPGRPGELGSPRDTPWGGSYGTPGPDAGYAYRILALRPSPATPGENPHDVEAALASLMVARASGLGRAPVATDADVAELLLGYRTEGLPAEVLDSLAAARRRRLPGFSHDKHADRELVAAVGAEILQRRPDEIRERLAGGERVIE